MNKLFTLLLVPALLYGQNVHDPKVGALTIECNRQAMMQPHINFALRKNLKSCKKDTECMEHKFNEAGVRSYCIAQVSDMMNHGSL